VYSLFGLIKKLYMLMSTVQCLCILVWLTAVEAVNAARTTVNTTQTV